MLSGLLPGIREIRPALLAGLLWLLFLWLVIEPHVTAEALADPLRRIYDLGLAAGSASVLAAVAVGAYLLGSLTEHLTRPFDRHVGAFLARCGVPGLAKLDFQVVDALDLASERDLGATLTSGVDPATFARWVADDLYNQRLFRAPVGVAAPVRYPVSLPFIAARRRRAVQQVKRQEMVGRLYDLKSLHSLEPEENQISLTLLRDLTDRLRSELPEIELGLIDRNREWFQEVGRHRAEAAFRTATLIPGCAIAVLFAIQMTPLWLFLVVPLGAVFMDGLGRDGRADARLARLIHEDRITPLTLERLRSLRPVSEPRST